MRKMSNAKIFWTYMASIIIAVRDILILPSPFFLKFVNTALRNASSQIKLRNLVFAGVLYYTPIEKVCRVCLQMIMADGGIEAKPVGCRYNADHSAKDDAIATNR